MAEFEHIEELVTGLYTCGAIGFAETEHDFVKLKSGRMSPHYVNLRGMMSFSRDHEMTIKEQSRVRNLMIDGYVHAIDNIPRHFDHIVGIPQAVTHVGGAVAQRGGYSAINIRVKEGEKGYGKHKPVEGDITEDEIVVAIDDVVTDGKSKDEVVEPLNLASLLLEDYVVMVDREEGGEANVNANGRNLTSVMGMTVVTNVLAENGLITPQQKNWSEEYRERYPNQ